jgi:glycerol-3-phosphate acyltransferase PlsY
MDIGISIAVFLAGYLPGSISFARIISRMVDPNADLDHLVIPVEGTEDSIRMTAMGGVAAGMALGRKVGCTVGLLDMLKAFLPVLLVHLWLPDQPYFLITAIAAVIGHNWPVFYRFRGGRGISAVYGGLFAVDWLGAILVPNLGLLFGMAVLKDFAVAYLAGLWLMIPWFVVRGWGWAYVIYALILNVLFTVAMIPEIRQIIDLRRKLGRKGDLSSMMNTNPMGQMMLEWGEKLKLTRRRSS